MAGGECLAHQGGGGGSLSPSDIAILLLYKRDLHVFEMLKLCDESNPSKGNEG